MWGFFHNVSVAFIKPIATEAFLPQSELIPDFIRVFKLINFMPFSTIFKTFQEKTSKHYIFLMIFSIKLL
jgi:hypothetical protein